MSVVAPTITASSAEQYRQQMEMIGLFASRMHVDFADGSFAPTKMLPPQDAWLPDGYECDLHVMYTDPASVIETLISLSPNLIVLHAESEGNILGLLREIKATGIRAGIALLQNTQPEEYANEIEEAEHTLVFGGKLGYHGGKADLANLSKIDRIKEINPLAEIGWDGGVNDVNATALVQAGVHVLKTGGFIHKSDDPNKAYAILNEMIQ